MAKILLVEDDNNLREIYEARLQAEGYTIVAANDGEQALVVAKNERPDLVISDVMMPKISGFEMLDILRNTEGLRDVKVIMLTALGQSEDKTRADQLGANKYLVKSQVTLEDIVKTAHQLLDDEPAPVAEAAPATAAPAMAAPAPTAAPVAAEPTPAVAPPAPEPVASEPVVAAPVTVAPAADPASADPVAAAPVTTPAPEPTAPTTLPDPAAVHPLNDEDPTNDPLSTAEEASAMQAKINDFEATPMPDAPVAAEPEAVPVADPAPTPAPAIETAPAVATPAAPAPAEEVSAQSTNDATMAQALDSLGGSSEPQRPSEVTAVEVPPAPTAQIPAPDSTPAPTPAAEAPAPAAPAGPAVAPATTGDEENSTRKKIIQPIGDAPEKKDINQLLAEEMAKQDTPPSAVVMPTAPLAAPASDDPNDPNNVAL